MIRMATEVKSSDLKSEAKRKPCPVHHTEQGEGTNLNHKILCSRWYYITPTGDRQVNKMNRQRTRRERAARWAEFWATLAVAGCIGLVWLFGVYCGFAIVEAAW